LAFVRGGHDVQIPVHAKGIEHGFGQEIPSVFACGVIPDLLLLEQLVLPIQPIDQALGVFYGVFDALGLELVDIPEGLVRFVLVALSRHVIGSVDLQIRPLFRWRRLLKKVPHEYI